MLNVENGRYKTTTTRCSIFARLCPSAVFYLHFLWIIFRSGWLAKRGKYDDAAWEASSRDVLWRLESIGLQVEVEGLEYVQNQKTPVIFIGNHMSMMETLLLPALIRRSLPVTFVIKESLLHYPIFRHVMRSRNPIAVTRTNPRADLKTVLTDGGKRLADGISIIVFPQTTRQKQFDAKQMSTIGVKLAQRTETSIIPIALKTDAWENGSWFKDFGRINPQKKARFAFGKPIPCTVEDRHEMVNSFIADKLNHWQE